MAGGQKTLNLIVYAPELTGDDRRPVEVVHGMERALPGLQLEWIVSDDHDIIHLPQRDEWLAEVSRGGFPLVYNNDEHHPVMVSGLTRPAASGPGGQAMLDVHVEMPPGPEYTAAAASVLEAVAEGARAFWGRVLPGGMAVTVAAQFSQPGNEPRPPPHGLPALKLPWELPTPEIPHYLGWVNYWSAAAARAIGFPDPDRDADLLSRARRTATGGWVVQLTDAPLDLDNPAHLEALKRAYERFPVVGGRAV